MKVLHICSNYVSSKIFPNLLYSLNKISSSNFLFCPVLRGGEKKKNTYLEEDDNVFKENAEYAIISDCFTAVDRFLFFSKREKIRKTIEKEIALNDFEKIMAHSLFTDGWVAFKLSRKYQIKYSVFVQNTDINIFFKIPGLRWFGKRILMAATNIVFASNAVKRYVFDKIISKNNAKLESKTTVIPFAIEDIFFKKQPQRKELSGNGTIKVITVATIDKNKNQICIVKALNELKQLGNKVELALVGKIVQKECLDRLLGYEFVRYIGVKTYAEIIELYKQYDIMALLSRRETFGLVYAEAMSQGLPVIYSAGQGFDGQFNDGDIGFAVDSENSHELAERLIEVIKNYSQFSNSALIASKRFCWDKVAEQYDKILRG